MATTAAAQSAHHSYVVLRVLGGTDGSVNTATVTLDRTHFMPIDFARSQADR